MEESDKNSGSTPLSLFQALVLSPIPIFCSYSVAPAWTPAHWLQCQQWLVLLCRVTFSQGLTVILKYCPLGSRSYSAFPSEMQMPPWSCAWAVSMVLPLLWFWLFTPSPHPLLLPQLHRLHLWQDSQDHPPQLLASLPFCHNKAPGHTGTSSSVSLSLKSSH